MGCGKMQQQYQCSNCGAPVTFGMRFCGSCGVQLNWPTQQQTQHPPNYQHKQFQQQAMRESPVSSDIATFWLPVIVASKEIRPRYDSILCINERGGLACIVLPEMLISMARAKIIYKQSNTDIALIQHIRQGKDNSYLAPIIEAHDQVSKLSRLIDAYNRGNLKQELNNRIWSYFVKQIKEDSLSYFQEFSVLEPLERAQIIGNDNCVEPDFQDSVRGCVTPVFIYTSPGHKLKIDKDIHRRELLLRKMYTENEETTKPVEDLIKRLPAAEDWLKDKALMQAIVSVEFELRMGSDVTRPEIAEMILDPTRTDLVDEPQAIKIEFKPEAKKALEHSSSEPKSCFSISNFGEPNLVQVILHSGEPERGPLSVPLAAVTIIRDELGIHTLPTYLFSLHTDIFQQITAATPWLDDVPATQIPEIQWQPVTGYLPKMWWLADTVAKKILWLVTRNLCSHQIVPLSQVTFSVTPIGDNTIQVAISEGDREEGAPYAFAVTRGELEVSAIPIFPSGTYEHHPNGSITIKKPMSHKSYSITRQGERQHVPPLMFFDRPIYSAIISGSKVVRYTTEKK
jgi:hypothetical protein